MHPRRILSVWGIGMIHQHFKLVDVMTAKENIIIGQPSGFFVKGKLLLYRAASFFYMKSVTQKFTLANF